MSEVLDKFIKERQKKHCEKYNHGWHRTMSGWHCHHCSLMVSYIEFPMKIKPPKRYLLTDNKINV